MNQTDMCVSAAATTSITEPEIQQITLTLTPEEAQILEQYCEQTGKSEMDMILELIQGLTLT
ncbi:MAG: CopG family transcriptional regulator [Nostoc sp. LLA-1]|nr:CopG family transcriptional regulator [Cyanocohniella sp. LLY]